MTGLSDVEEQSIVGRGRVGAPELDQRSGVVALGVEIDRALEVGARPIGGRSRRGGIGQRREGSAGEQGGEAEEGERPLRGHGA